MSMKLSKDKNRDVFFVNHREKYHINKWVFAGIMFFMFVIFLLIAYETHSNISGISVTELVTHPRLYHKKKIAVVGKIDEVTEKLSIRGNEYYTTKLTDGKSTVNIFSFGDPDVKEGQVVRVIGYYTTIKYLDPWIFENELDLTYGNVEDISTIHKKSFYLYVTGLFQRANSNHKVRIPDWAGK